MKTLAIGCKGKVGEAGVRCLWTIRLPTRSADFGLSRQSVQQKLRRNEASLDRIYGQAELLEHREPQQNGISRLSEQHSAGRRVAVDRHRGLTHVSLDPPPVGQDKGNSPEPLDSEPFEKRSRDDGQGGSGIGERDHRL